jgi:hypothetical protein
MAADDQLGCNWASDLLLLGVAISCWGGSITGQKGKKRPTCKTTTLTAANSKAL